ncbi:MAG: protein-L-isoaspartate(D-aspartate) O-methyltransferase [Natronomonas sp.]
MIFGDDPEPNADFETRRNQMVDSLLEAGQIERPETEAAMRAVPRHEFVPENRRSDAYDDRPLPIGHDQTISAPHMVATMCDRLELSDGDRVLEIGTGCGYHAAVTAEIVDTRVYSVEYEPTLAEHARTRLDRLGYDVAVRSGDGHDGWSEHAPYDATYLTCAAASVPESLVEQLRDGGRIVAPIESKRGRQRLLRGVKRDGTLDRTYHGGVRFVRMRGG